MITDPERQVTPRISDIEMTSDTLIYTDVGMGEKIDTMLGDAGHRRVPATRGGWKGIAQFQEK
ncbi:hypothetical protein CSB20_01085 [bacterium DOLZORAL124_64_63]|nr:MAG: hypothetical protein CSB20_01085 [bacterium DOLZORAL124_64_63]